MRLLALGLALLLAGCASPAPQADAEGKGPDWSLTALDGSVHTRDAPPGNATVLFFMATWCGSCRAKAPVLADVLADAEERGVRVYSVGFDPSESPEELRAWQERYRHGWPIGVDEELRVARAFGVRSQSSVVVLDADGRVVQHFGYGQVTDEGLRAALERALRRDAA